MDLTNHTAVEVRVQEGNDSIFVVPEKKPGKIKKKEQKTPRRTSIDVEECDKFLKEIKATGEENIIVASLHLPVNPEKQPDGKWTCKLNNVIFCFLYQNSVHYIHHYLIMC